MGYSHRSQLSTTSIKQPRTAKSIGNNTKHLQIVSVLRGDELLVWGKYLAAGGYDNLCQSLFCHLGMAVCGLIACISSPIYPLSMVAPETATPSVIEKTGTQKTKKPARFFS